MPPSSKSDCASRNRAISSWTDCTHAADALKVLPPRAFVDRPVNYWGSDRTVKLARQRYDLVFAALEREVHYVYEPLGAASASSGVSISLQIEGSAWDIANATALLVGFALIAAMKSCRRTRTVPAIRRR
jgi:hypothetical protein